jgi:hypothetical protein
MSDLSVQLWHQYLSKVFLGVVMLFGVVACGSSDDSSDPDSGYLQVINGLNDSPDLKFELRDDEDDVVVSSGVFWVPAGIGTAGIKRGCLSIGSQR